MNVMQLKFYGVKMFVHSRQNVNYYVPLLGRRFPKDIFLAFLHVINYIKEQGMSHL